MSVEPRSTAQPRFEPLRPASRASLITGVVAGPVLWLATLVFMSRALEYSWAVVLGLLVAVASFVVSLIVLALIRVARRRQERRYVDRG